MVVKVCRSSVLVLWIRGGQDPAFGVSCFGGGLQFRVWDSQVSGHLADM